MNYRISPFWWPLLLLISPVLIPVGILKYIRFRKNAVKAEAANRERVERSCSINLPELEYLELTVLLEKETLRGFKSTPAPAYIIKTDRGSLLFDVGYGAGSGAFSCNAEKLGFKISDVDSVVISHLHPDHMGGMGALLANEVRVPPEFEIPSGMNCYVTDSCRTPGFVKVTVKEPVLLPNGIASTGPLSRSLFIMGNCEEQALVANIKSKGLVIITGCGHQPTRMLLELVQKICDEPVYAIIGGFHLPVTDSSLRLPGIKPLMIFGTGKPPWKRITDKDVDIVIEIFRKAAPERVLLSLHDSCGHTSRRMNNELNLAYHVLKAGESYQL